MVIEVGLPAAVFGLAAVLMVTLLLVNRLHASRDARRAVLERQAELMLTAWHQGRPIPGGLVPWSRLSDADQRVMLTYWAHALPSLEGWRAAAARTEFRRAGVLAPVALLAFPAVRENEGRLHAASLLVIFGFVANRLNVTITGIEAAQGVRYIPAVPEILISAVVVAAQRLR